ncbi:MAG: von Willebrand factor type A domain-containing protein, partial [Pseudomonadota bacterium]
MPLQKVGTRITQGRVQGRRAAIVGAVVVANAALLAACSTPTGDVASTAKSTPTDVAVAPPPSPPPPPPAAPEQAADAEAGQAIVVTGSRVTPRNMASAAPVASVSTERRSRAGAVRQEIYAPPVVVPIDPGRERYDGEEISPVKLTSAEPVSTFSVDVDTGAYANTRRHGPLAKEAPRI